MKKYLKMFLVALLVVPVATVFAACGKKSANTTTHTGDLKNGNYTFSEIRINGKTVKMPKTPDTLKNFDLTTVGKSFQELFSGSYYTPEELETEFGKYFDDFSLDGTIPKLKNRAPTPARVGTTVLMPTSERPYKYDECWTHEDCVEYWAPTWVWDAVEGDYVWEMGYICEKGFVAPERPVEPNSHGRHAVSDPYDTCYVSDDYCGIGSTVTCEECADGYNLCDCLYGWVIEDGTYVNCEECTNRVEHPNGTYYDEGDGKRYYRFVVECGNCEGTTLVKEDCNANFCTSEDEEKGWEKGWINCTNVNCDNGTIRFCQETKLEDDGLCVDGVIECGDCTDGTVICTGCTDGKITCTTGGCIDGKVNHTVCSGTGEVNCNASLCADGTVECTDAECIGAGCEICDGEDGSSCATCSGTGKVTCTTGGCDAGKVDHSTCGGTGLRDHAACDGSGVVECDGCEGQNGQNCGYCGGLDGSECSDCEGLNGTECTVCSGTARINVLVDCDEVDCLHGGYEWTCATGDSCQFESRSNHFSAYDRQEAIWAEYDELYAQYLIDLDDYEDFLELLESAKKYYNDVSKLWVAYDAYLLKNTVKMTYDLVKYVDDTSKALVRAGLFTAATDKVAVASEDQSVTSYALSFVYGYISAQELAYNVEGDRIMLRSNVGWDSFTGYDYKVIGSELLIADCGCYNMHTDELCVDEYFYWVHAAVEKGRIVVDYSWLFSSDELFEMGITDINVVYKR